jgi:hypothetical protein
MPFLNSLLVCSCLLFILSFPPTLTRAQSISTTSPVPPLQWINLSGLLQGPAAPPLKDASIGYDDTTRNLIIFGGESQGGLPQQRTYLSVLPFFPRFFIILKLHRSPQSQLGHPCLVHSRTSRWNCRITTTKKCCRWGRRFRRKLVRSSSFSHYLSPYQYLKPQWTCCYRR